MSTSVAEVLRRAYLGRRVTLIVKISDTFWSGVIIHALWAGGPRGAAIPQRLFEEADFIPHRSAKNAKRIHNSSALRVFRRAKTVMC